MKRCVILEQHHWDALPSMLAQRLARMAEHGHGRFRVIAIDSEAGETPIDVRLDDWLCGMLVLAFQDVTKAMDTNTRL